jgi:hypothetical protein
MWSSLCVLEAGILNKKLFKKVIIAFALRLSRIMILAWCLHRFNAFIFLFGKTITNRRLELFLMKALGKRIIFLYLGSDSRPPFINGPKFSRGCPADLEMVKSVTGKIKRRLKLQERYGDVCINSPSSAQFHSKPFIDWFILGLPKRITNYPARKFERHPKQKVRILHSPSRPLMKGTPAILKAIDNLTAKGHPIEFVKIEGMPNSMVLDELARCDFVVDQLYSDTPLAAFATEAAHFGKPAVVGGYFAPVMTNYLKEGNIPPSLFVHPDEIEQAIEKLIIDVDYRLDLGRQAEHFVRTRWAPKEVARRFLHLIEGDIPKDWWFNPQDIRYVHGCGIPEIQACQIVCGLIDRFGKESLQVGDKPALEKAFLKFAGRE